MPALFQFTPRAIDDLDAIWTFIAADNPRAADRVESAILSACAMLSRLPSLGSKRAEITPLPIRFWSLTRYPNFVLVYYPDSKPLQVIAVLHASRDIAKLIEERENS